MALDENKIQHLADITSLARLPFLMNLDVKGNPLEVAGMLSLVLCLALYCLFLSVFPLTLDDEHDKSQIQNLVE